jgi:hypothetical protein
MKREEFIVEAQWEHNGLPCVCIIHPFGHRCGYVGVPEGHTLYGVSYHDEIPELRAHANKAANSPIGKLNMITVFCAALEGKITATPEHVIQVHGSLTYSGSTDDYPVKKPGYWWFGFDCGHCDDAPDPEFMSDETLAIFAPLNHLLPDRQIRTLPYVREECNSMADQLQAIDVEVKGIIAARK